MRPRWKDRAERHGVTQYIHPAVQLPCEDQPAAVVRPYPHVERIECDRLLRRGDRCFRLGAEEQYDKQNVVSECAFRFEFDTATRRLQRAFEREPIPRVTETVYISGRVDDRQVRITRGETRIERDEPQQFAARVGKSYRIEQTKGLAGLN